MGIPQKVKLLLAFKSHDMCAFPDCRSKLTTNVTEQDGEVILGEAAHIRGVKPGSARHDSSYPANKLHSFENLIYLCPNCHTRIDKQPNSFSVDTILGWKNDHISAMSKLTEKAVSEVGFSELRTVTDALISRVSTNKIDLKLIPPKDKIKKNKLSEDTQFQITLGLAKSDEVRKFIHEISTTIPRFDDNLVEGFKAKYQTLNKEGLRGDALFDEMLRFACNGKTEPKYYAAGLSILVHLFQTCDVFEK